MTIKAHLTFLFIYFFPLIEKRFSSKTIFKWNNLEKKMVLRHRSVQWFEKRVNPLVASQLITSTETVGAVKDQSTWLMTLEISIFIFLNCFVISWATWFLSRPNFVLCWLLTIVRKSIFFLKHYLHFNLYSQKCLSVQRERWKILSKRCLFIFSSRVELLFVRFWMPNTTPKHFVLPKATTFCLLRVVFRNGDDWLNDWKMF